MPLVSKTFSQIVTFSRTSGATWFNSAGVNVGIDLSTSSVAIGTGSKTFTLDATAGVDRSWTAGDIVRISEQATPANFMDGTVTSYTASTQTLVVNVTATGGSGTIASWRVSNWMPRFDYNPSTLAAQGLLIEEQRANSLLRSAEFDNASWGKTRATVTANTATAPDGTTSADSIVEDGTAANTHDLRQGGIVNSATTNWTLSFFLKAVNRTWALIELQNATATSNRARAWFNLQTGVVGTGNAAGSGITYVSHSIQNVGNGWYRCVVVGTVDVSVTSIQAWVEGTIADNTANYDGVNGQTSIYIWGAQLEAGAFPTSYIPTTTTALTRNADQASVNTLSPWYNQTEGTVYAELQSLSPLTSAQSVALNKYPHVWQIDAGATDSNPFWYGVGAELFIGGTYNNIGVVPSGINKFAVSLAASGGQSRSSLNGAAAVNRNGTLTGTATGFFLGRDSTAGLNNFLNGYLRRLTYYPRALSAAELQAITA